MAAVAFSLFCFSRGKSKAASLCASLAYVLCGYVVMLAAFRHAFFINFAILLPLIFMGADRLFANKSPWLFIGAFAVSFIYSVYTSYMACIFLLVYCLIVYFAFPRRRSVGDFALLVAKFAGCLVLGFLLSAVLSLPSITSLLSMERIGMERPSPSSRLLDSTSNWRPTLREEAPAITAPLSVLCQRSASSPFLCRGQAHKQVRDGFRCSSESHYASLASASLTLDQS